MSSTHTSSYIGRFAPSPSGPLHFGSLVCALASYVDAKRHNGRWLVRIEDIDPPREQAGASEQILRCLEAHGLHWDGEVRYQSRRSEAYWDTLNWLKKEGLIYSCTCTRKRLAPLHGRYDGLCKTTFTNADAPAALRLKVSDLPRPYAQIPSLIAFSDGIKGEQSEDLTRTSGDFVIHRKDGFFAYQLAVVVDDIDQDITHIVRGDDLLDTTAKQIYLYRLLNKPPPVYSHIPVILDHNGNKLSKQNHAPAVDQRQATRNLIEAFAALDITCNVQPEARTLPSPQTLIAETVATLVTNIIADFG